jgi:hypothetical protein
MAARQDAATQTEDLAVHTDDRVPTQQLQVHGLQDSKANALVDHTYHQDKCDNMPGDIHDSGSTELSSPCVTSVRQTVTEVGTGHGRHMADSDVSSSDCETAEVDCDEDMFPPGNTSSDMGSDDDDDDDDQDDDDVKLCKDKKYIVFDEMLDKLLFSVKCPFCSGSVSHVKKSYVGSMVRATIICTSGHEAMKWASQPSIGKAPVGNILGAASILFSGNTYNHISHFANLFGLQFFGKTMYYDIQKSVLVPAVNTCYLQHMEDLHKLYKGKSVCVSGDGRCDSPGYNAKYGSYTLMNSTTHEILAMALVQVSEVSSSNAMEKHGCSRSLDYLQSKDIKVNQLATDRHTGIAKLLRENYKAVTHQYDVWHVTKSIKKKLTAKAKKKGNEALFGWIRSICNQVWYACQHCNENPEILTEKICSILHHVANVHYWDGNKVNKCDHDPLTVEETRKKKWLVAGSGPHTAIQEVLCNKKLVKDLRKLTKACHTGQLEVFHSLLLKYCPKRQEFDYPQMLVRLQLAVLDHNNNLNRQEKTTVLKGPNDSHARVKKYRHVYSKQNKMWVSKAIKEGKSYDYVQDIMVNSLKAKRGEIQLIPPVLPSLPKNIAPIPRPPTAELLANASKSRFLKK